MSAEKSGFNIRVTCSQDPTIAFGAKSKQRPGLKLGDKIDTTTDASVTAKDFEPGDLLEITDAQISVPDDFTLEQKIKAILGVKGTITFTSAISGKAASYPNSWFSSYAADSASLADQPMATISIQSGGGEAGLPVVA